jgi:predicted membrane protein
MASSKHMRSRIFWGLVLITVGILLFFDQMGRLDFGYLIGHYWPAIFIIIGLSILIGSDSREKGAGIFFVLFGAFFLLLRLRVFDHTVWHYFWPLLIIALGLWIMVRPAAGGSKKKTPELSVDELAVSQVFSGTKRRVESANFKGGSVEVVLGNADIDLTQARLEGGRATLAASAVLGRIDLRVPPDWRVVVEGTPVLGSIEHDRKAPVGAEGAPVLELRTSVVLASIHIES